jgi:hypothetical protein
VLARETLEAAVPARFVRGPRRGALDSFVKDDDLRLVAVRLEARGDITASSVMLRSPAAGAPLVLDHDGFPAGQGEHLAKGWHQNYWEPLARYLA